MGLRGMDLKADSRAGSGAGGKKIASHGIPGGVILAAILFSVMPSLSFGQGNRPVFRKAGPAPSSQHWIDQLNAMPESVRRSRITGYQPAPVAPAPTSAVSRDKATQAEPIPRALEIRRPAAVHEPMSKAPPIDAPASIAAESPSFEVSPLPPPLPQTAASDAVDPAPARPVSALETKGRPGDRLDAFLADCDRLSRSGLKYEFGSNDPGNGGLDCSGTVQYLLQAQDVSSVPRQSNHQYEWLEKKGTLKKVGFFTSSRSVLRNLKPGDLLFWKGTRKTNRKPNVTHVMVYLGKDSRTGKHLMFGARSEEARGVHGHSVDVFEFDYPFEEGRGKFIAYGRVPDLYG